MLTLIPLACVLPLAAASLLGILRAVVSRLLSDTLAIALSATTTTLLGILTFAAYRHGTLVYWFGGWHPAQGVSLGIDFVVSPFSGAVATLAALLTTAALGFAWRYFNALGALFPTLMLVFLSAMVCYALSGDLFTLFVFFELMSTTAYALTGYKIEEEPALMGAFSFAVTNTVGAFMMLIGIGLLYGRTGALNLAQIGRALDGGPPDGLVIAALVLIMSGFAVKAAIVPLHFWLDDAHAVAPTPVCVLFSGVMVELGLYAIARVYWTVFAGVFEPNREVLRAIGVAAGTVTVLVGGVMAFCQSHLKRLLAFSTISHVGMFLLGLAMLSPLALAGASLEIFGHGLIKGALFLGAGLLLNRFESVDVDQLRGRGKRLPILGTLMTIAALALCGMPFLGLEVGEGTVVRAAEHLHYGPISLVMLCGSILTGGAVLRALAGIFLGLGAKQRGGGKTPGHEDKEVDKHIANAPPVMLVPIAILLLIAVGVGLMGSVEKIARAGAETFVDHLGYAAAVLDGTPSAPGLHSATDAPTESHGWPAMVHGLIATCGALALAALALFPGFIPRAIRRGSDRVCGPFLRRLRALHSGHIGDYVTWLLFGVALFGGLLVVFCKK